MTITIIKIPSLENLCNFLNKIVTIVIKNITVIAKTI